MKPGSFVIIYCQKGKRQYLFRATVRIGDRAKPGLSLAPDLSKLDTEVVRKYREELNMLIEQTEAFIASPTTSSEDRSRSRKILAELCLDVPVLGTVEEGRPLTLKVSPLLPTPIHPLGRVDSWRISNA
ncbi:MAG: hypothetical protein ABIQ64_01165 [Candidatus Saccharimonadales bacterium]